MDKFPKYKEIKKTYRLTKCKTAVCDFFTNKRIPNRNSILHCTRDGSYINISYKRVMFSLANGYVPDRILHKDRNPNNRHVDNLIDPAKGKKEQFIAAIIDRSHSMVNVFVQQDTNEVNRYVSPLTNIHVLPYFTQEATKLRVQRIAELKAIMASELCPHSEYINAKEELQAIERERNRQYEALENQMIAEVDRKIAVSETEPNIQKARIFEHDLGDYCNDEELVVLDIDTSAE
jgi:hypothetical protein